VRRVRQVRQSVLVITRDEGVCAHALLDDPVKACERVRILAEVVPHDATWQVRPDTTLRSAR